MSPDYVAGVSGWSINKDGSAEFNNVTVRGTFVASTPGTTTTIDSNGIVVAYTQNNMSITPGSGFFVRREPNDGGFGQLHIFTPDVGGGFVRTRPATPTGNGNTITASGLLYSDTQDVAGVDRVRTQISSPGVSSQDQANLYLYGETSDGNEEAYASFDTKAQLRSAQPVVSTMGRAVSNSAIVLNNSATQVNVGALPAGTYVAGRTYKMTAQFSYALAVAGSNTVGIRFRLLSGGAAIYFVGTITVNSTTAQPLSFSFVDTAASNHTGYAITMVPGTNAPAVNVIPHSVHVEEIG